MCLMPSLLPTIRIKALKDDATMIYYYNTELLTITVYTYNYNYIRTLNGY